MMRRLGWEGTGQRGGIGGGGGCKALRGGYVSAAAKHYLSKREPGGNEGEGGLDRKGCLSGWLRDEQKKATRKEK